ncbi:MAG: hypothetical protein HQK54_00810 [Oligoflexales bacterium]|nr:hypothetical protein [Oligoflexales bacterium]
MMKVFNFFLQIIRVAFPLFFLFLLSSCGSNEIEDFIIIISPSGGKFFNTQILSLLFDKQDTEEEEATIYLRILPADNSTDNLDFMTYDDNNIIAVTKSSKVEFYGEKKQKKGSSTNPMETARKKKRSDIQTESYLIE